MFVVMTRVKLREGTVDRCAELFRKTNPDLVKGEVDWLGASMMYDSISSTVTVLARWRTTNSYERMSATPKFQSTMRKFSDFFEGPPEITTNDVLVEMTSETKLDR